MQKPLSSACSQIYGKSYVRNQNFDFFIPVRARTSASSICSPACSRKPWNQHGTLDDRNLTCKGELFGYSTKRIAILPISRKQPYRVKNLQTDIHQERAELLLRIDFRSIIDKNFDILLKFHSIRSQNFHRSGGSKTMKAQKFSA